MLLIKFAQIFCQTIKISPHFNTQVVLSKNLTFFPDNEQQETIWSLDYNGKLFRIRHKKKYMHPSDERKLKLLKGGSEMDDLVKTESFAPLISALKLEKTIDSSSSSSSFESSSTLSSDHRKHHKKGDTAQKEIYRNAANADSSDIKETSDKNKKESEKNAKKAKKEEEKQRKEYEKRVKKAEEAQKTKDKKRKDAKTKTNDDYKRGLSNNVDPVVLSGASSLLGSFFKGNKKSLALESSFSESDLTVMGDNKESLATKGPGFYFELIPVFHDGLSKKLIIKYKKDCLTSNMTFEPCPFGKWWKLPTRFYWHIYPTVDNLHINKISNYLCSLQQTILQNRKTKNINFDHILEQQGIVDPTKFQESEESCISESSSDECDCEKYCREKFKGFDANQLMNQRVPRNVNCSGSTLPMYNNSNYNCMNINHQNSIGNLMAGAGNNGMNQCCNIMDCTNTHNFLDRKSNRKRC